MKPRCEYEDFEASDASSAAGRGDKPFCHRKGVGAVAGRKGAYYDALKRRATVIPMIVESFGGISPHTLAYISRLAARTKGARARDGTAYGRSRTSATSFFVHHTQQLAAAAQVGDAKAIRRKITQEKMLLMKRAARASGRA